MAPRFVRKDQLQRTNFEVIAPRVAVVAEPPVHEASPKVAGSHLGEADLGTPQDCRPASLESGSSDDRSGQLVQRGDGPPELKADDDELRVVPAIDQPDCVGEAVVVPAAPDRRQRKTAGEDLLVEALVVLLCRPPSQMKHMVHLVDTHSTIGEGRRARPRGVP